MGKNKVVEEVTKKKKKGRPSLLDLQKRTLKEQQQLQPQNHAKNDAAVSISGNSSPTHKSATPLRRSTRRNPNSSSPEAAEEDEEEELVELNGKRREKKLKLVLKLPNSNAEGDDDTVSYHKKRKINAIGDGSDLGGGDGEKGEKHVSDTNPTNNVEDLGPSTPLPDKKLLVFILDRLQKKDTYGAFSEPVDPNELPDYREVIEHPMDFATIRKKLSSGAYANLEQFEKDVSLICMNAMQYNAPDTIYFRQARSIQELAIKNFENLRQDSDNEQEPKVVRRGRPPTKNLKKPLGRPPTDRAGSEFSSDTTLPIGGERNTGYNNEMKKGPRLPEKSGFADSSGRVNSSRNDAYRLSENRFERSDEATGTMLKGYSMKHGKKQSVLDENRRNTYKQFHSSAGGRGLSVLSTFDAERKHLMAVGPLSDHGYARSLARFSANIGPVSWRIASKRIEKSLPPEVMFGLGWVGENDIPSQRPLLLSSPPSDQSPTSHPLPLTENSSDATTPRLQIKENKLPDRPREDSLLDRIPSVRLASEGHSTNPLPASVSSPTSIWVPVKSESQSEIAERVEGSNAHTGMLKSSMGVVRPRPPFQIHQNPVIRPGMNGINGTYGLNLPGQMSKPITAERPPGFNFPSSQKVCTLSRTSTDNIHPATANSLNAENSEFLENSSTMKSCTALPNSGSGTLEALRTRLPAQSSRQGLSMHPKPEPNMSQQQKSDAVPTELSGELQSPASMSSSRVDSAHPDLALQL